MQVGLGEEQERGWVGRTRRCQEVLVLTSHWQKFFPFPVSGNEVNISPGRRFMIDLLVGSLMADGGLESALNAAITAEIQVCF